MKVIIAGSRRVSDSHADRLVEEAVAKSGFTITEVVSGTARGVDQAGEEHGRREGESDGMSDL